MYIKLIVCKIPKIYFTAPFMELSSNTLKAQWEALASGIFSAGMPASASIDGKTNTDWGSTWAQRSWLRVKMDGQYWVKGARIRVRSTFKERTKHLEVGAFGIV